MNRAERRQLQREQAKNSEMPPWIHDTVMIGYIHPGELTAPFVSCVNRARTFDLQLRNHNIGVLEKVCYSGQVAYARNIVTEEFLKGDEDWLWFIDTDMGFPEWALTRLLNSAYLNEFKPVIGGLTFAQRTVDLDVDTWAEERELFPVMGEWNRNDDGVIQGFRNFEDYDKNALIKVGMTGAAMLLIHRSALETIGKQWWTQLPVPEGAPEIKTAFFSEDLSFMLRCEQYDIPVWVDTGMPTSHRKTYFLTEQLWELQQAMKVAGG